MKKDNIVHFMKSNGILLAFVLIMVIFSVSSEAFLSGENISLVFRQVAVLGVMALAITFVMIGGNFDLSIGSTLSFTTIFVLDLHDKVGPLPAIIISLIAGIVIGCINGWLIGLLNINSIIVTLGMLMIIQGLTFIYSGGQSKYINNPDATWFPEIGRGTVFGIAIPIFIFLVLAIIFWIVHKKTLYGRYLIATGSNKTASFYTGIQQNWVVFSTFVISGLAASIGGIMLASRALTAQNSMGAGYEVDVLAAVILGGTSLLGGKGSIFKVVIAVLILGFVKNGLILIGFDYYYQWLVTWAIILFAVSLDLLSNRERRSLA